MLRNPLYGEPDDFIAESYKRVYCFLFQLDLLQTSIDYNSCCMVVKNTVPRLSMADKSVHTNASELIMQKSLYHHFVKSFHVVVQDSPR